MNEKNFWEDGADETENLKLGSTYPPVKVFLSAIIIARLNSNEPVMVPIMLSDGKELDLEIRLETDRDVFSKDIRKVLDEVENSS